jgi:hypothetical protein
MDSARKIVHRLRVDYVAVINTTIRLQPTQNTHVIPAPRHATDLARAFCRTIRLITPRYSVGGVVFDSEVNLDTGI